MQKRNSEALSAMTFAATLGDVDSIEHLLQRGLLINTADYDGRTTLHLAALEGNVKVLELLLQEGADPNVRDRQDSCPNPSLYFPLRYFHLTNPCRGSCPCAPVMCMRSLNILAWLLQGAPAVTLHICKDPTDGLWTVSLMS